MFVDRLMSQTADENIPSSVGMFQCCILSCGFFFYICIALIFISAVIFYIPSSTSSCSTKEMVYCVQYVIIDI